MQKKCSRCDTYREVSEFSNKYRPNTCDVCLQGYRDAEQLKKDAEQRKDELKAANRRNVNVFRDRRRKILDDVKRDLGCVDCEITNPVVLCIRQKDGKAPKGLLSVSDTKLMEILEDCMVICFNCLAVRSYSKP